MESGRRHLLYARSLMLSGLVALFLAHCGGRSAAKARLLAILEKRQPGPPWVLRSATLDMAIYVDSSRIGTKVEGYPSAVWLRFNFDPPRYFTGFKQSFPRVDLHFDLDCDAERARLSQLTVYDSAGGAHSRDMPPQEMPGGTFSEGMYAGKAVELRSTCAWLRDRSSAPVIDPIVTTTPQTQH